MGKGSYHTVPGEVSQSPESVGRWKGRTDPIELLSDLREYAQTPTCTHRAGKHTHGDDDDHGAGAGADGSDADTDK